MNPVFSYNAFKVFHLKATSEIEDVTVAEIGLSKSWGETLSTYFKTHVPLTFVLESDYIDKDWSSLLSLHYSAMHGQYRRHALRTHIFKGLVHPYRAIFDAAAVDAETKAYLGYFTVYHTRPRCIGRTHLSARKLGLAPGVMWCTERIRLAGQELTIEGFPFTSQDGKVTCCAHVAIWEIIRYFNLKYGYYGEYYMADIARLSEDPGFGRSIPTSGLFWTQILSAFGALRIKPTGYGLVESAKWRYLWHIAVGYIRSGIPVIIGGQVEGQGHAIVGIGLTDPWGDKTDIIVHDDNHLPYGTLSQNPLWCGFTPSAIEYVIAPLYAKIIVPYETSRMASLVIRSDSLYGFGPHGIPYGTNRRTLLTSSKSYKRALCARTTTTDYEFFARTIPLPKFVWITEFFHSNPKQICCEYVLDATTSTYDWQPFLLLRYPSRFWYNHRTHASDINDLQYADIAPPVPLWDAFPGNLI